MVLTDESPMPFGRYKGKLMANIPASYLLYIYDNGLYHTHVKNYIEENLDALKLEVKNNP